MRRLSDEYIEKCRELSEDIQINLSESARCLEFRMFNFDQELLEDTLILSKVILENCKDLTIDEEKTENDR